MHIKKYRNLNGGKRSYMLNKLNPEQYLVSVNKSFNPQNCLHVILL